MSLESLPPELLEPIVLLSRNPGPLSASCRALHNLFSSDSLKAKIFLWMAHDARKAQKKELQTPASTASLSSGKRTKEQAVPVPVISKFDFAGTPLELSALFVAVGFPACKFTTLSALDRVVALRKGKRSRVRIIRPKIGSDVELGIPRWLAASEDEGAVPFMLHLIRERGFEPTRDALVAAVKSGNKSNLDFLLQHYGGVAPDILLPLSLLAPKPMLDFVLPLYQGRGTPLAAALKLAAERADKSSVQTLLEAGAVPGDVSVLKTVRSVIEGRAIKEGHGNGKHGTKKRNSKAVDGPVVKKRRKFAV